MPSSVHTIGGAFVVFFACKWAGLNSSEEMNRLDRVSLILVIIGALNWASIGIFGFDFISYAFGGQGAAVSRIIYTLVGLAGIWCISLLFRERSVIDET